MDPTTNPYRPGAGTTPPALIGRDDLIAEFGVTLLRAVRGRPGKSDQFLQFRDEKLIPALQEAGEGERVAPRITAQPVHNLITA